VVLVEGPHVGVHVLVAFPRLRDHHQHGLGQGYPAHVQQFERLVEPGGVRRVRRAHREDPREVAGYEVGPQQGFAGAHEVAVALDRVDLTVVGDHPVGVGERPHREGVGGEARVHQRQCALDPVVVEVGEELGHLAGGEHALVDEGAARQAREVDPVVHGGGAADRLVDLVRPGLEVDLVFYPLADDVGLALQAMPLRPARR
jgi:hypothetical protein